MFKILDGRDSFFQWDLNQKLIINDDSITEVHFSNKTEECALVCEVYNMGDLRIVDVPNILLQEDWSIRVYGVSADHTKHYATFRVFRRSKPADYVYTETEVRNFESLQEYIDEAIWGLEEYVDDLVNNLEIPEAPQADYMQDDSTAADYIKNRTHYINYEPVAIVENASLGNGLNSLISYSKVKDYSVLGVNYDGVTYRCPITVRESITEYGDESYFYAGNFQNNAPEYPFSLFGYLSQNFSSFVAEDSVKHTVSIYGLKEVIHKLDKKYLPDSAVQIETVKKAVNPYFNGDIEEHTFLMLDILNEEDGIGGLVKITDYILTEEECLGATVTFSSLGYSHNEVLTKKVDFTDAVGLPCDAYYTDDGSSAPYVVVIKSSGICSGIIEGVEVSAGTYYLYVDTSGMDGGKMFTTHFSALDNKEVVEEKINPKYLPNEVALKSDIPSIEGLASEEYVDNAIANLPTGGGGSGEWVDVISYAETTEDISKLELSDLHAKEVVVYGMLIMNDANSSTTSGTKRANVYVNDRDKNSRGYSILVPLYARKGGFNTRFDIVSKGGLIEVAFRTDSGVLTSVPTYQVENNTEPILAETIDRIVVDFTVDGAFFLKAGSMLGVKAYV